MKIFLRWLRKVWTVLNGSCIKRTISVEDEESDKCFSSKVNNIQWNNDGGISRLSSCSRRLTTKRRIVFSFSFGSMSMNIDRSFHFSFFLGERSNDWMKCELMFSLELSLIEKVRTRLLIVIDSTQSAKNERTDRSMDGWKRERERRSIKCSVFFVQPISPFFFF